MFNPFKRNRRRAYEIVRHFDGTGLYAETANMLDAITAKIGELSSTPIQAIVFMVLEDDGDSGRLHGMNVGCTADLMLIAQGLMERCIRASMDDE